MKAIAKYLPVEGEIKDGDTIRHIKGELQTAILKDGVLCIETEEYSGAIGLDRYKVVKLFAVTREALLKAAFDQGPFDPPVEIDALGPLSPKATWVKDGDEIEIKSPYDGEKLNPIEVLESEILYSDASKYQVKCSQCNTYH